MLLSTNIIFGLVYVNVSGCFGPCTHITYCHSLVQLASNLFKGITLKTCIYKKLKYQRS